MNASRIAGLQGSVAALDCDALCVLVESSTDPHIAPLLQAGRLGRCLVVVPRVGEVRLGFWSPMERSEAVLTGLAILDCEDLEVQKAERDALAGKEPGGPLATILVNALRLCGVGGGRIALAGLSRSGELALAALELQRLGFELIPGEAMILRCRKSKLEQELAAIREASAATVAAFTMTAEMLREAVVERGELWLSGSPVTVGRLKQAIGQLLGASGYSEPDQNIVAPAEEGAVPHHCGTPERRLREGESLVVDIFPKGRMYADCTRTFCKGVAPQALLEAHQLTLSVLDLARGRCRPGANGWQLQQEICAAYQRAGWPTSISHPGTTRGYVHGLGHGVGYALHEYPTFAERATEAAQTIEVADVVTLEPGLYDEQAGFAVRLEDLFIVGEHELECTTPLPYELDPNAWRDVN